MHPSKRAATNYCLIPIALIGILLATARGATDQEQTKLELAYQAARKTGDALLKGDYQTVIDLTYPKVVEILGGPDKELATIRQSMDRAKRDGFALTAVRFEKPAKLFEADGRLFTIIPESIDIKTPDGKSMTHPSYLLAISNDGAKSWKLVDGGTVSAQQLRQVIPELPAELKLPNQSNPAPAATLSTPDGRLQLRLPDGWEKDESDPSPTEMWAVDKATGASCMVTWVNKSDDTHLVSYAQGLKDEVQKSFQDVHSTDPKDEPMGGHRTISWELTGTAHGIRCGLVLTAFETDTRIGAIFVKCKLAQFDAHKAEYSKLAEGLTETAVKP